MHTTGLQTDDAAEHQAANLEGRHPVHVRRDYDVQSILAVLRRQTKPIIGLTLLGGAVAALYLLVAPLQYTATARLMIDTRGQKIFDYNEVRAGLNSESSTIESQVEVLRSRRIAERVLRASEAPLPLLKGEKADNETTRRTAFERSLRDVMRGITVERQGLSYVVDVSFRAADRERAARIANALADAFVADQYEQKEKLTREAGQRLKAVIAKTDAELAATEAQIRNHRGDRLAGESNGSQKARRDSSDGEKKLAAAKAKAADARQRLESLKQLFSATEVTSETNSAPDWSALVDLQRRQADAKRRLDASIERVGQQNATVREVRNELSTISRAIEQEVARRSQQTTAELELANTEVAELERQTAAAKPGEEQRASSSPIMAALERDAEATRQVLASLLKRQKEIDAQQTLQTADAQVIAYAAPPLSPSSPKKILTIVAALLAGLVLGLVVALLRDSAAARLNSTRQPTAPNILDA